MNRYLIAVFLAFAAAPLAAQPGEWRHAESGVVLPREFGDMRVQSEQEFGGAGRYDVFVQLGSDREPATLYVYRSAYPNPALWFERVRTAINGNVGAQGVQAEPRAITVGGAPAANGLREEFDLPAGGPWRSTAVTIIQAGEWIVKARITSATLDRTGIAARMDRLMGSLRFARPIGAPHSLRIPAPCSEGARLNGRALTVGREDAVAAASAVGLVVLAEARGNGGIAAEPSAWCRAQVDIAARLGTAYRRLDGSEWTVLVGDSGRAISARLLQPALPGRSAATFANVPNATRVVNLFDALPDIAQAFRESVPVLMGQSPPLAEITMD